MNIFYTEDGGYGKTPGRSACLFWVTWDQSFDFTSDGQFFPASGDSSFNDFFPAMGFHPGHKTVGIPSFLFIRLVCAFRHNRGYFSIFKRSTL